MRQLIPNMFLEEKAKWIRIATTLLGSSIVDVMGHSPEAFLLSTAIALGVIGTTRNDDGTSLYENVVDFVLGSHTLNEEQQNDIREKVQDFAERNKNVQPKDEREEEVPLRKRFKDDDLPELTTINEIKWLDINHLLDTPQKELFISEDCGENITLNISKAYHILIIAQTGGGKTTIIKQLIAQLLKRGNLCYYIHPKFAKVGGVSDPRVIEVWDPIVDRIHEKLNPEKIKHSNRAMNEVFLRFEAELNKRNLEKGTPKELDWKTRYLFVDEGREVVQKCPDAQRVISRITSEGRQLGVRLCIVSTSAQVQALGIPTSDLSNFATRFYLGADSASRTRLMPGLTAADEKMLDQVGAVWYTSNEQRQPILLHIGLMSNETLFEYFDEVFEPENYAEWFRKQKIKSEDNDIFDDFDLGNYQDGNFEDGTLLENTQNIAQDVFVDTKANFKQQIEAAIENGIEHLRSKNVERETINGIVRIVNELEEKEENGVKINGKTHKDLIIEIADDYGYEIIRRGYRGTRG